MDVEELNTYQQQLIQINQALLVCPEGPEKTELLGLKSNIEELLELTNDGSESNHSNSSDKFEDEFATFMAEMEKEGAVGKKNDVDLKDIEGKKCKAPHQHQWGNVAYHNAMICSVVPDTNEELKVKVLYTNPTHQEMLPCPFYFESDCKFSEEQCRFSHGEVVLYSSLQEYVEPNFALLTKGSSVLAKQSNNLWYRAKIKSLYEEKCLVKFECDSKELEVKLEHVFPLESDESSSSDEDIDSLDEDDDELVTQKDIINQSLMITPGGQALGDWEKYTKGMGSKLMIKMGYIVGTGLGKNAAGRINPVSAVIFPAGKSLDHCMNLKEQAGGDKDLFSVEKKMKRLQKKQEIQSKKAYERELKKQDVFTFINNTVQHKIEDKNTKQDRENLKQETVRNLNIKSLQVEKDIKDAERDLHAIRGSLGRHTDVTSDVYKKLKNKCWQREQDLETFRRQAQNIKSEQGLRDNKKKMTIF